jgi:hypothetical protein
VNVSSGHEKKRLTEVLTNHMTYHVASGCEKKRLTEVLINHMTCDMASGCGKKRLTVEGKNSAMWLVAVDRTDSPKF